MFMRNLSVLAYAQGFTLWQYRATGENKSDVLADGFFDHIDDMFTTGDVIYITDLVGGRVIQRSIVVANGFVTLHTLD